MTNDLELIKSRGINYIRIYGSDCNSVPNVLPIAASLGLKVNQGFWFSQYQVDSIDSGVSDLISYGQQYGWDVIDFVTVGNEAINDGFLTVSQLTSKIASVKSLLQAAGYTGQITTAEPPNSFIDNPSLCTQSAIDFVSVNAHSYFDQYAAPSDAGTFVAGQVQLVQNVCGSKNVFVAETGYPSQGATNGLNVPTPENQAIAIQAILSVYGTDITILTTFDDFWKAPGPYGIEQYFGAIQLFS
ncbi:glycoside hydrolase superfamily [Scheffersomyces amazonensis]|uniref:glycoside hydrolase superfamily n=1 Tax=Scheffersomyces amazonensis TaxID=1078765 RepID=UPI00315CCEF9